MTLHPTSYDWQFVPEAGEHLHRLRHGLMPRDAPAAGRHHDPVDPGQPHRDRRHRPGEPELAGLHGQRRSHRLPGVPGRDPGRQPGRHDLHGHGTRGGHLQLHGARGRRGGQPLQSEQHRDGHRPRHHHPVDPGQPDRDRRHRSGGPELAGLDGQRGSDRLPGVPGRDPGREPDRHDLHGHGTRGRQLQLHGARGRRRGQPLRPEQHRQRDRGRHDQADAPPNLTATAGTGQVALSWQAVDGQRGRHRIPGVPRSDADRDPRCGGQVLHRHGPRARALQLHGAGGRRGRERLGPEQHRERDRGRHDQADAPPNLTATAGTGQVALSWQASTDNVGVTGYQVFRGATQIATLGAAARSYTDTGLAAGPYSYTVRAVDAAGNLSDPSNTASATVPDTTKPSAPANLTATAGTGQVALGWQASTDNVGVTGYQVFRGRDADRDPRRGGQVPHRHRARPGHLQLHGAGGRRGREPLGPEQHGERHGAGHHQADRTAEPQRELRRHHPGRPHLGGLDRQRRR